MGGSGTLISIYPEDLTFLFELDKRCYCNLKVVNNSEHHAAFKVHGLPFHDQYFLKLGEKA
uniref:Expressed protein n=4 Tax=Oryza TaxID=4527 RepID=Q94LV2_ORYSJ|nr:hypothetical protein [Oryza sativa Japonica Group]AAP54914.1 expressed protein [Oryza sativa Japonica Group]